MKIRLFSEDHRDGLEVDWPAVPREGELVAFRHRGGTSVLRVERVSWNVETDGSFSEVEIGLTY